ncbi:MAG: helix-turn-helix transcriptional regulator [Oscillibacter sp.]|nr:helix-turn-helix transcriptional regulator [Oscillibacter sp.]
MKKAFGETLRRIRMTKGLTQQQLASQLKVDRTSVTNWETGRH